MEPHKRPVVKLDNGRRVKSTFENEHFYFYRVREESTANEICEKLKAEGLDAKVGSTVEGPARWFVRVRYYDVLKD